MTQPTEIIVSVTPHEGMTLMECSACGPVAITDQDPATAATAHLNDHGVETMYRRETT